MRRKVVVVRMPTSRTDAGFTLVELLAVLAILAMAAAAFSWRSQSSFGMAKFRALLSGTTSALREARAHAISGASDQVFIIDIRARTLSYKDGGIVLQLPRDVDLVADVAQSETYGNGAVGIRFFRDGTSTGGKLRFDWNRRDYAIDVNWLTGNVSMHGL